MPSHETVTAQLASSVVFCPEYNISCCPQFVRACGSKGLRVVCPLWPMLLLLPTSCSRACWLTCLVSRGGTQLALQS